MPFGLITKKQLDVHLDELRQEFQAAIAFEEEIKLEWADWYAKFRGLYMRLKKAEAKAAKDDPGPTNGDEPAPDSPPAVVASFRSRRQF
jgi:hypothetical protein